MAWSLACAGSSRNDAGTISLVEGEVTLLDQALVARTASVGGQVFEGDSIVTGPGAELHLDMADGGVLSVRPNTKMKISRYQANGEARDIGVFSLLQGSFRSVTGWIGLSNRDRYQVRTPMATLGIRGTDHEPLVIPMGSSEGEPGLYDKVNEGATYLKTSAGRIDIARGKVGFTSLDGRAKPRLLQGIPDFFRPRRNDARFANRYREIQEALKERRAHRQQLLKKWREEAKARAQDKSQTPAPRPGQAEVPRGDSQSGKPATVREEGRRRLDEAREKRQNDAIERGEARSKAQD